MKMLYRKRKPLSCVCGSSNTEFIEKSDKVVQLYCVQCNTRNFISKKTYLEEFDLWLDMEISKMNTINKLSKIKNKN